MSEPHERFEDPTYRCPQCSYSMYRIENSDTHQCTCCGLEAHEAQIEDWLDEEEEDDDEI